PARWRHRRIRRRPAGSRARPKGSGAMLKPLADRVEVAAPHGKKGLLLKRIMADGTMPVKHEPRRPPVFAAGRRPRPGAPHGPPADPGPTRPRLRPAPHVHRVGRAGRAERRRPKPATDRGRPPRPAPRPGRGPPVRPARLAAIG